MRQPTQQDRDIAERISYVALSQSNNDKQLIAGQVNKQNRLAERVRTKKKCPFVKDSTGQWAYSEDKLADSLDEELYSELKPEVIEYLMVEYNNGHYDTLLVQSFLFSEKFQKQVIQNALKQANAGFVL